MPTQAVAAIGTLLKIGDGGSPETFTTIAEVRDITGPSLSLTLVDVTSHDSTGNYIENIPTFKSGGTVTFQLNFLPSHATQSAASGLLAAYNNRTLRNFQLVFTNPGNTTWSFAAYVTQFTPSAPVQGALTASVTLSIQGAPTLA
jgi:predicted secreted protein